MNSTSPFFSKFNKILKATAVKLSEEGNNDEYHKILEQVGPAPGQPWDQHDTMESFNFYLLYFINFSVQVSNGLCEAATKHVAENRYCNLFPFDEHRVKLTGLDSDYVNASWVSMPGVKHKFILTMAPLHPDSKAEHSNNF